MSSVNQVQNNTPQTIRQISSKFNSIQQYPNEIQRKCVKLIAKDGPIRKDYETFEMFLKEASLMFAYIYAGWSDATPGALIPSIRKKYDLSSALVSLIFVSNLVGWILAAIFTPEIIKRFTVGRSITLMTSIAIIPALIISAGAPFPLMATMFCFFGLSIGGMEAIANAWISDRPNKRIRLACLHFSYGLGALLAPLAGTPFIVKGLDFHHFYFASLGLCVLNTIFVTCAFKFRKEGYPGEQQQLETNHTQSSTSPQGEQIELQTLSMQTPETPDVMNKRFGFDTEDDTNVQVEGSQTREHSPIPVVPQPQSTQRSSSQWKALLRQRDTHIFAFFCLFYVGTEVSIGGWTSTFIIQVRKDVDQSGHIVSGFWAGLAAGRVLLLPITHLFGAQLAVIVYILLSIILQIIIWIVPNIIANAISIAIQGMLLGPMFPIMIELISYKIIPRSIQTRAIAYIVSFGSAGAALFPLLIGQIIQIFGAKTLAPTLLTCLCIQLILFASLGIPKLKKSTGEAQRAME